MAELHPDTAAPAGRPARSHALGRVKQMTVAIDFDGVLSQYAGDPAQPPGPPVPQAREFVEALLKQGVEVVIFSSRDQQTIIRWLQQHDFPVLPVFYKPPVVALIDDRAVRFRGEFTEVWRKMWEPPWWHGKHRREHS